MSYYKTWYKQVGLNEVNEIVEPAVCMVQPQPGQGKVTHELTFTPAPLLSSDAAAHCERHFNNTHPNDRYDGGRTTIQMAAVFGVKVQKEIAAIFARV